MKYAAVVVVIMVAGVGAYWWFELSPQSIKANCYKQTHALLGVKSNGLNVYAESDNVQQGEYQDCLSAHGL